VNQQEMSAVMEGYVASHPFLEDSVALVGVEAVASINASVGAVRPATSMRVDPGFRPSQLHQGGSRDV